MASIYIVHLSSCLNPYCGYRPYIVFSLYEWYNIFHHDHFFIFRFFNSSLPLLPFRSVFFFFFDCSFLSSFHFFIVLFIHLSVYLFNYLFSVFYSLFSVLESGFGECFRFVYLRCAFHLVDDDVGWIPSSIRSMCNNQSVNRSPIQFTTEVSRLTKTCCSAGIPIPQHLPCLPCRFMGLHGRALKYAPRV